MSTKLQTMQTNIGTLVVALLLAPGVAYAQLVDAALAISLAALKRSDHATALKVLPPLAEQGNAAAQFNLGLLYDNGRGVARDHAEALKWYRLAAVQGNAGAQRHLGELYYDGLGVAQDTARAYMWLHLAAGAGDARAAKYRDLAARRLKPPQVAEVQKEARACQMNALMASLPVAGVDGTMVARLRQSPAAGKAFLKTGSVPESRTLAGYVRDASGKLYIAVVLVNHPNAEAALPALDATIDWLYRRPNDLSPAPTTPIGIPPTQKTKTGAPSPEKPI